MFPVGRIQLQEISGSSSGKTRSTFKRVVARANELFPSYADRKSFAAFVERLARAVGRDFQRPPEEVVGAFDLADSVRERLKEARQAIELQFLAALRALMNKAPHLIDFDPKTPRKLRFDAVAAGAPEEVVQVMERCPDEVADMASAALRAKDAKRHLEWLLAMKRASPEPDAGEPASFKP